MYALASLTAKIIDLTARQMNNNRSISIVSILCSKKNEQSKVVTVDIAAEIQTYDPTILKVPPSEVRLSIELSFNIE